MTSSATMCRWFAALTACLSVATAAADTVVLTNGDHLTGTITHLSAHKLTLDTPWGGELKIDRNQVASFETEGEVEWLPYPGASPLRASFARVASVGAIGIEDKQGVREVPISLVAVINPAPEETADGFTTSGTVNFSTSGSDGNSEHERIWAEADLAARALQWRSELRVAFQRERDHGETSADNWLATGKYDRFFDADSFRYLRGSLERDRFKDLSTRAAMGGGVGLQLIERAGTELSVRGGVDLVIEERAVDSDDRYPAAGWGVALKHRTAMLDSELFHDQEGFWNLEDSSQITLRSRSGIRVPVGARITASLQLNLDWEREPSAGRRSTDWSWLFGLGYRW